VHYLSVRSVTNARLIAGAFFAFLLGACATPQTHAQLKDKAGLPMQTELAHTPFYPQEAHQCGPASLATVLNAAGVHVDPAELTPQLYIPGREGSLQVEMLATTRRHGMVAYQLAPKLDDLLAEVVGGHPVVVLQNLGLGFAPMWHYAVAIGYDLKREEIILRSGKEKRQTLLLNTFEHTWSRSDYWAMLALPPGKFPKTVQEDKYVAAVVDLEHTGKPKEAQKSYSAALTRWPRNLTAQIGLGNTAYAMKDIKGAEAAFRRASKDHPDSAAAFNNLAQTLYDQKRYREARVAARKAVSLGGPLMAASKETLQQIEKKLGTK
jgi:hypothetical protein